MITERYRFLLALTLVLVSTFISMGAINYSISEHEARTEVITKTLPLFRDSIYNSITQLFQKPTLVSSSMASNTFVKKWAEGGEQDPQVMVDYLAHIRDTYGFDSAFFVSAKNNVYYHYSGVHRALEKKRPEDQWFFSFLASKKAVSLDINTDDIFSKELMLFTDFRVENDKHELLGITGVAVKFSNFSELLGKQKDLAQRVYLVNEKAVVQVHTNAGLVERHSMEDMPGRRSIARDILAGNKKTRSYEIEGERGGVIVSVRYIPEIHWYLVVEQDEHSFMQGVWQNLERTALIGGLATLLVMGIALVMANRHQRRVSELAITDSLTGLVNRRGFGELFNKSKARATRNSVSFALAVVDLDYFKEINDKYGHHVGDSVLKEFANRVTSVLRGGDVFARWGGDEFMLLMEAKREEVTLVLERVSTAVESKPVIAIDGEPLFISLSCGVTCLWPEDTLESASKRADVALYNAKADGRGCFRLDGTFSNNM